MKLRYNEAKSLACKGNFANANLVYFKEGDSNLWIFPQLKKVA